MTKIKKIPERQILNLLECLRQLHFLLSNTQSIHLADFLKKYNVSPLMSPILQNGGIIKKIRSGRLPLWEWSSIDPNKNMAREALVRLYSRRKALKQNTPVQKETALEVSTVVSTASVKTLDSMLISIGFIKIRVKYNYK